MPGLFWRVALAHRASSPELFIQSQTCPRGIRLRVTLGRIARREARHFRSSSRHVLGSLNCSPETTSGAR
jgi:hypothetical protein